MKSIYKETVLITGGSKGIGFAIAKEFAKNGHNIILVARSENDLEKAANEINSTYNVETRIVAIDLTEEQAPEILFKQLDDQAVNVDILVNNAGVGMTGNFAESNYDDMTNMLQLNMLALTQLTHLFIKPMLKRKHGRILNVGSLVAYFSGAPNWSAYVASKHYVMAFTKGLSRDLKGSGVTATVVSAGTTATDFVETADASNMLVYRVSGHISVEKVAETAYRACLNGKVSVIPGFFNKILAFLGELHPRSIAFEVFSILSQKRSKQ